MVEISEVEGEGEADEVVDVIIIIADTVAEVVVVEDVDAGTETKTNLPLRFHRLHSDLFNVLLYLYLRAYLLGLPYRHRRHHGSSHQHP
jgi:hypothetical protein